MTDLELYYKAKEAYYNGEAIMTDYDFDELEKKLGLENKSYVGSKHNPSYTIEHPFIMGSLSKVQIKEDEEGNIDFKKYAEEIGSYLFRNPSCDRFIAGPKYDGCSFEAIIENNKIKSISTRGDGYFGRDIYKHIIHQFDGIEFDFDRPMCLRGEVLIKKNVFNEKYSEFVNPRSFVSGVLNADYNEDDESFIERVNDLSIVIYDTRAFDKTDGKWTDFDWKDFMLYKCVEKSEKFTSLFPTFSHWYSKKNILDSFDVIYEAYAKYRSECEYALDGIVIKPSFVFRENNIDRERPIDCIAVKFVPMLEETEIEEIIWSTKKTNELIPVIRVKAVTMDGKQVTKASAHNYGYLIDNKVSVGTKVILSLAGDIIPFIYKITDSSEYNESKLCIPQDFETYIEGCHLYKKMSQDEVNEKKFIQSAAALNIPTIGTAAAQTIYDYMKEVCKGDEFFDIPAKETPDNILYVNPEDIDRALGGKLGTNAKKAFIEFTKKISLTDIIISCTFDSCGSKAAEQIQNYMLDESYDFAHLSKVSYEWCMSESENKKKVVDIMKSLGITFEDFKTVATAKVQNAADQIPVILTGEPNNYKTKADFLMQHPEYRQTGKWSEVKIVFTNSLESNTGKMKQARAKNIEIRLY